MKQDPILPQPPVHIQRRELRLPAPRLRLLERIKPHGSEGMQPYVGVPWGYDSFRQSSRCHAGADGRSLAACSQMTGVPTRHPVRRTTSYGVPSLLWIIARPRGSRVTTVPTTGGYTEYRPTAVSWPTASDGRLRLPSKTRTQVTAGRLMRLSFRGVYRVRLLIRIQE